MLMVPVKFRAVAVGTITHPPVIPEPALFTSMTPEPLTALPAIAERPAKPGTVRTRLSVPWDRPK